MSSNIQETELLVIFRPNTRRLIMTYGKSPKIQSNFAKYEGEATYQVYSTTWDERYSEV